MKKTEIADRLSFLIDALQKIDLEEDGRKPVKIIAKGHRPTGVSVTGAELLNLLVELQAFRKNPPWRPQDEPEATL